MSEILKVKDLSFSYGGEKKTLNGVSFSLSQGESLAIIGHNGSGKSTLAKVLMGLILSFDGEVKLFGSPLNRKSVKDIRKKVGIVFQNPDNQFVGSTVADDIAFGLENRMVPQGEMDSIIAQYAKLVGMDDCLDKEPQNLSGGQKQRVAIAGVLAMGPDLVIFDEATSMLDPKGRNDVSKLIDQIKLDRPGVSFIKITHDLNEALNADKVLVLNKGKTAAFGTPSEVFSNAGFLKELRLNVPFFFELRENLKANGVDVPTSITDLKALEEWLCR